MSQRQQRSAPAPSQTQTETPAQTPETREQAPQILRLRGAHASNGRSVQWAEDVVDNEGLGRKSSKGE
jgi:protein phosphatase 1 regulatory subunit 11